jgi:DNA-binding MarR family transcriptional regulator
VTTNRSDILETLLVANTRITRTAALTTGSTVSSAVWQALSVLCSDGPRRIGDLARDARISQPGMTKVVQNLVTDEWVLRIADTEDSRAWLIAVTDKGRDALDGWRAQLAEALAGIFTDLDDAEWKTLERAAAILKSRSTVKENVA